jgi:hypothetical protein
MVHTGTGVEMLKVSEHAAESRTNRASPAANEATHESVRPTAPIKFHLVLFRFGRFTMK